MFGFGSLFQRATEAAAAAVGRSLTGDWADEDLRELVLIAKACSTPAAECRARYLLSVMWVEGRGARADARNPTSSATGLLQWMGVEDRWYGRTRDAFCALGVTGQLPYVRAWFLPHRGQLDRVERVYTAVFLPAFVRASADPEFVLCADDSPRKNLRDAYVWNKYFDRNKDGRIQVRELGEAIEHELAQGSTRCRELFARLAQVEAAMA